MLAILAVTMFGPAYAIDLADMIPGPDDGNEYSVPARSDDIGEVDGVDASREGDNLSCNSDNYCATYKIIVISGFAAQFDVVGSAIASEIAEAAAKAKQDALLKVSWKLEGYGVFRLSDSHCGDATVHKSESNIRLIDVVITCDIPSIESELTTMFESNPSGSIVQINGTVVGITPMIYNKYRLTDIIRGVNVRIVHEGYVADEFPFRPSYQNISLRRQLVLEKAEPKSEPDSTSQVSIMVHGGQSIYENLGPGKGDKIGSIDISLGSTRDVLMLADDHCWVKIKTRHSDGSIGTGWIKNCNLYGESSNHYNTASLAISIPLLLGGGVLGGIAFINKEKRDRDAEEYDILTGIEHDWFLTEETKKQQNALLISAAMLGTTGLAVMLAGTF